MVPPIDVDAGRSPWAAARRSTSPSRRQIEASVAPQNRAALSATTSITGWRSVGELDHPQNLRGGRLLLQGLFRLVE